MTIPEVTPVRELDEIDGPIGSIIGYHVSGHVEDDVAIPLVMAEMVEWGDGFAIDPPRRCYVSEKPVLDVDTREETGTFQYVYSSSPRDGWEPVTVVMQTSRARHTCALCPWDGNRGFHVSNFIDPPKADDNGYVWLCETHGGDFSRRLDAERRRLWSEIRNSRGAA